MPESRPAADSPEIGLAEMIASLRRELQTALAAGQVEAVRFDVDKIELELKVGLSRKQGADAGVAFWVLKAGARIDASQDTMHTFKLSLTPVLEGGAARLRVGAGGQQSPAKD